MKDFDPRGATAGRRGIGMGTVLVLHVLVVWALVTGLARKVVEVVRPTVTMAIIPEVAPAPPPPAVPPPKPAALPKAPREAKVLDRPPPVRTPPPPAFVPQAEVHPVAAPAPVIQAVQDVPPAKAVEIAPVAPPAPPAPAAPAKVAVGLLCPGYQEVLHSALEGAVERVGIEGEVRVRITVQGQDIVDAQAVSGPREYFRQVQSAVRRFRCTSSGTDQVQTAWLTVGFRQE